MIQQKDKFCTDKITPRDMDNKYMENAMQEQQAKY